jgi:3D (Asp-Asp-Asp) domain-containing protein
MNFEKSYSLMAALVVCSCTLVKNEQTATIASETSSAVLTVGTGETYLKSVMAPADTLKNATEKCVLIPGESYSMSTPALAVASHYYVRFKWDPSKECNFREGYVYAESVKSVSKKLPVNADYALDNFSSEASLYTVENTEMEGGGYDRCDNYRNPADMRRRLSTLEEFLAGKSNWVALAMDAEEVPYGTIVRIPEIEEGLKKRGVYNGRPIIFVITDGGGAFNGRLGWSRFDLCVGNSQSDIYSPKFNWMHHTKFSVKVLRRGETKPPNCGADFRPEFR